MSAFIFEMAFAYGPYFQILHLDDRGDADILAGLLMPKEAPSAALTAARRLHALLTAKTKTVVLENDYIDLDFRACFSRLYYLRHSDLPRRCRRLHFFNERLKPEDLGDLSEQQRKSYRGFVVIRPLPLTWLGRSILSNHLLQETIAASHSASFFLTCSAKYTVNLAGNDLDIIGAPWLQQDTMVSACASAAIWVASWHMSQKFAPDFKTHLTPSITDYATRTNIDGGRAMPSSGLTTQQILFALREMGYEPLIYTNLTAKSTALARRLIYYYVESSIPVILGLQFPRGGHAVTIVGHTLDLTLPPEVRRIGPMEYCLSSDFVPGFIAQDDAGGPFRIAELKEWGAQTPQLGCI
jgi:hypothetical protein